MKERQQDKQFLLWPADAIYDIIHLQIIQRLGQLNLDLCRRAAAKPVDILGKLLKGLREILLVKLNLAIHTFGKMIHKVLPAFL